MSYASEAHNEDLEFDEFPHGLDTIDTDLSGVLVHEVTVLFNVHFHGLIFLFFNLLFFYVH